MPFIVLEGLDGAGKSTQVKLLQEELTRQGYRYEYLHFPRFDTPVYGELIAQFLRGELGAVDQVSPYLVALIYAGDRAHAATMIRTWLSAGTYVIVDRYVYSNIGYQCAKVESPLEYERLRQWILDLEYTTNQIPRPDISLFLDVPFVFTQQKLQEQRQGDDRSYLQGKTDIHEASLSLQESVRKIYLDQLTRDESFRVVSCADPSGNMLPPEAIFQRIMTQITPLL